MMVYIALGVLTVYTLGLSVVCVLVLARLHDLRTVIHSLTNRLDAVEESNISLDLRTNSICTNIEFVLVRLKRVTDLLKR